MMSERRLRNEGSDKREGKEGDGEGIRAEGEGSGEE